MAKSKPIQLPAQWPATKVEQRSLAALLPYAQNPRLHSDDQVVKLASAIEEYGWTIPCLIDEKGEVIAGHGRLLAAQKLGITTVPVMVARGWTEAQRRSYRIWDNQSTLLGTWDNQLLAVELQALEQAHYPLSMTGFDEAQLVQFMAGLGDGTGGAVSEEEQGPTRELTEAEKELMIKAWQLLAADWLAIIKRQELLSTNFSKGAAAAHFLRARFYGIAIPQLVSLAFNPHRALIQAGRQSSLLDGLHKATTNENNIVERLWFVTGEVPRLDKMMSGSLPFLDARLALDFPSGLAQEIIDEFAEGGDVLDPCHGWGGRMLGFLLSSARYYHGFDTDERTVSGVREMFDDLVGFAVEKKHSKLEHKPFEDAKLENERYDLALTSPPYFNVEKYGGELSSWQRYKTLEAWTEGFYRPLLGNVSKALRPGGVFALQVGNQTYPLEDIAKQIAPVVGLVYGETRTTALSKRGYVGKGTEGAVERDPTQHEVLLILRKGMPPKKRNGKAARDK